MARIKKQKKPTMSLPVTLLMLVLSAVLITLLAIYIQPGLFRASMRGILKTPSLIVLNGLPALVLVGILYCLCGNVFASAAGVALVIELLSYANLLKQEGRTDPLVPADVLLLRESLAAAGDYQMDMHPGLIALIAGSILCFVLLAVFVRSSRPRWPWRILSGLVTAAVFVAAMLTIYPDKDYYGNLPDVTKSNVPLVFNTYGFPYCFLHNFNLYPIDKPLGYQGATVAQWETETLETAEPMDVNILFVMGEAFSDLSDEAAFDYTPEENPLYAYYMAADSDQAISGHMVVSNFGAGTANTEFDVLTGMQTNMISPNTTSAFRAIHRNVDSLARVYGQNGYHSWFMHPGDSWFYNRCHVYAYFGIEDQTFNSAFSPEDRDGTYITDQAFLEKLKEGWGQRAQNGNLFAYTVTIENHQAYTYTKYSAKPEETVPLAVEVSQQAMENLSVYFYGVRHTAEMIYELTEYLDTLEKPTLLVFFGDHRPALGADYLAYREVGSSVGLEDTPEHVIYTYEVPYMIWANDALCETYDFQAAETALELPKGNKISSNYLGSLVYELTGMTGTSAYWDYLTQARRILPVISHNCYYLPDGSYTTELTEEQEAVITRLDWWEYYRLKNGLS